MFVDLHVHSSVSTGRFSSGEILQLAEKANTYVLSLTDHNTATDPTDYKQTSIRLISGTEISCCYEGQEVHILGWGFNTGGMDEIFQKYKEVDRRGYIETILHNLLSLGVDLGSYSHFLEKYPDKDISRLHLAEEAVRRSYVQTTAEFLNVYAGDRGLRLAFVPSPPPPVSLEEGVHSIIVNGGVPAVAHPMGYDTDLPKLIKTFKGLCGTHPSAIEAEYGPYNRAQRDYLGELAHRYGLLVSPGSDYHGFDPGEQMGGFKRCDFAPLLEALNIE